MNSIFNNKYPFKLPDLPYGYSDLEPYVSSKTMEFHHLKHHATYVNNLNSLVEGTEIEGMNLKELMLSTQNDLSNIATFNNAAQVWNHSFFWECMSKNGGGVPSGELLERIEQDFGSYEDFKSVFTKASLTQFGSGWSWLVWDYDQSMLLVTKTSNADSPICREQMPIITLDVWEHAYYLDYQNRRPEYVTMFLDKVVNWKFAEKNFGSR